MKKGQISDAAVRLLGERRSLTVVQLAEVSGSSHIAARRLLARLCNAGKAYRTYVHNPKGAPMAIFHAGQKPVVMAGLPGRVFRDGVRA